MPELSADAGAGIKALGLNCTLKKSPEVSNTEALMTRVLDLLDEHGTETELIRPVDYAIKFGVSSDEGASTAPTTSATSSWCAHNLLHMARILRDNPIPPIGNTLEEHGGDAVHTG